jgi:hypothetical protein
MRNITARDAKATSLKRLGSNVSPAFAKTAEKRFSISVINNKIKAVMREKEKACRVTQSLCKTINSRKMIHQKRGLKKRNSSLCKLFHPSSNIVLRISHSSCMT